MNMTEDGQSTMRDLRIHGKPGHANYNAWHYEAKYVQRAGGTTVEMRPGVETERVRVTDVIQRLRFFPLPGAFIVRYEDDIVFIGQTRDALGVRLRNHVYARKDWTQDERFDSFTVSMLTFGSLDADEHWTKTEKSRVRPRFNRKRGRPNFR